MVPISKSLSHCQSGIVGFVYISAFVSCEGTDKLTVADVQVNKLGPEMSLLSGLDDFWLDVSYHATIRSMAAYNVTSLPEQFEVFHDYHQRGSRSDRPTRGKGATRLMTVRLSGEKREEGMVREYSRFSGLYLAYKTDNSVNIP